MPYKYKIGLIGPSRIGKTTIIASVMDDTQKKLLNGTPLSIGEIDDSTKSMLIRRRDEMLGAIAAGKFNPYHMKNTGEEYQYQLGIHINNKDLIEFHISDYPGGWLESHDSNWNEKCGPWINESSVLIIPVDAAIIMEAITNDHRSAVPSLLHITQISDIITKWAKARKEAQIKNPDDCSMIIIAPIKTEMYFEDNGGKKDSSKPKKKEQLENSLKSYYNDIINVPSNEKLSHCSVWYCPIDTYGCIELKDAKWIKTKDNPTHIYEFSANYMFRNHNNTISRKGASDILLLLICHFINLVNSELSKSNLGLNGCIKSLEDKINNSNIIFRLFERVFGPLSKTKKILEELKIIKDLFLNNESDAKILIEVFKELVTKKEYERAKQLN